VSVVAECLRQGKVRWVGGAVSRVSVEMIILLLKTDNLRARTMSRYQLPFVSGGVRHGQTQACSPVQYLQIENNVQDIFQQTLWSWRIHDTQRCSSPISITWKLWVRYSSMDGHAAVAVSVSVSLSRERRQSPKEDAAVAKSALSNLVLPRIFSF